jgi:L-lactate utilization protein LutC
MALPHRVPQSEAFAMYCGLGHVRSYAAVAKHYGVSTRAVLFLAKRYRWAERLREIEAVAEERMREAQVQALIEARERHLKSLKVLQGKALAGMRDQSARSLNEATRALETGIRMERLILGESTSNTQVSVEERQQREVDQLVVNEDDDVDDDDADLDVFEHDGSEARDA